MNTLIGEPGTLCTETFIMIGFNLKLNNDYTSNLSKYFSTKFSRFPHSLAISSNYVTAKTYKFVPVQDITPNSDFDWTKSIPEIDQQLYKKYQFSEEEVVFIERMIKPMA